MRPPSFVERPTSAMSSGTRLARLPHRVGHAPGDLVVSAEDRVQVGGGPGAARRSRLGGPPLLGPTSPYMAPARGQARARRRAQRLFSAPPGAAPSRDASGTTIGAGGRGRILVRTGVLSRWAGPRSRRLRRRRGRAKRSPGVGSREVIAVDDGGTGDVACPIGSLGSWRRAGHDDAVDPAFEAGCAGSAAP